MPSDWRVLTYAREHGATGNRLMMSMVNGRARYVTLVKEDGAYVIGYTGHDKDRAVAVAEGRENSPPSSDEL